MITDERICNNNLCVGEEVVCALIINGNLVKHEGYNIPTIAIIESINGNDVTVKDKYNVFESNYTIDYQKIEKILLATNGKEFYNNMIENSKKFNKSYYYKFSYGPAAANLYYLYNDVDYCLTFDYAYHSLYFRGTDNLLDIDLNNIKPDSIQVLNDNIKPIFRSMVKEMVLRTEGFTFCNIPTLIKKLYTLF